MTATVVQPTWGRSFCAGWAANFARKNLWRCEAVHDFDDLMQEAYLVFDRLRSRYPNAQAAQFTALFQQSFRNRVYDLARRKRITEQVMVTEIPPKPGSESRGAMMPSEACSEVIGCDGDGYLNLLAKEIPEALILNPMGCGAARRCRRFKRWLYEQ